MRPVAEAVDFICILAEHSIVKIKKLFRQPITLVDIVHKQKAVFTNVLAYQLMQRSTG